MKPTVSRKQHRAPAGQLPAAGARVERGEQLVLGQHVGAGQLVEQRALAGVRVADERDRHAIAARGHFALLAAQHAVQLAAQLGDPLLDQPAVGFQLLFARAAHADAGLDARQVGPHPLEPRQRVFELRQLDGQAGFVRPRTRREDIENHLGAIEHLDAQLLFQIADLRRGKIVVEDDHVGVGGADHQLELLDLALAEIGRLIGRGALLSEAADDFGPGGFHQAGQLVQIVAASLADRAAQRRPEWPTRFVRPAYDRFLSLWVRSPTGCNESVAERSCRANAYSCSIIPPCQGAPERRPAAGSANGDDEPSDRVQREP